ncbi:MAG: lipase family protein [Phycisphaeraceae bacterium]|nr:MAG: lipase family protein [Phycisphaeraceae bacterium]
MKIEMLDVLIGLVFVYFALSIVCSAVLEAISGWFNVRGKTLSRGIHTMLDEEEKPGGLADEVFDDPVIRGLSEGERYPSYIKPEVFAGALLRAVEAKGALRPGLAESVASGLEGSGLGDAGKVLAQIYRKTGGDSARVRDEVAAWYAMSMERVSGWYKRWTMSMLLAVGVVVALGTNADTIRIIQLLSTDSKVRESLVALASEAKPYDPEVEPNYSAWAVENRDEAKKELLKIGPVIGWTDGQWSDAWGSWSAGIQKALGLCITAFAITFGAPFWFDVLKKLANLRSSLSPDDKRSGGKGDDEKDDGGGDGGSPSPSGGAPSGGSDPRGPGLPAYVRGMVGFTPRATKPTPWNTYWLARWSDLSYRDEAAAGAEAISLGMKSRFLSSTKESKKDAQGYVFSDHETVIIAFRGTEPTKPADWLADLKYEPKKWHGVEGLVHHGIAAYVDSIWEQMTERIKEVRTSGQALWLTGHSLGGAMAVLAAARLAVEHPEISVHGVVTFGQPRVGDAGFAGAYSGVLGERTVRCVNNRDIVVRVPKRIMKFRDVGSVWYFDEGGRYCGDPGFFFRFLDTVVVTPDEFKGAAREGIADHAMATYVALCKAHAEGQGSA